MPPILYLLHSAQLFGTERMALATLQALGATHATVIAPPGPLHAAARAAGLHTRVGRSRAHLLWLLATSLGRQRHAAVFSTGVIEAAVARILQRLLGGRGAHLHLVHGGTHERLSYGRKRWLRAFDLRLVAVSAFVRDRLVAHGVAPSQIDVVHNFLPAPADASADTSPDTPPDTCTARDTPCRVAVLSRLDRIKRVGLLFDALACTPGLEAMRFDVYGSGEEEAALRERARAWPQVHLHGFVPDAASRLAECDVLLHTCPEEPFGLVMLEAFAASVPVLVPNSGGASEVVRPGLTGWHFTANDPVALGRALLALLNSTTVEREAVTSRARRDLHTRFSATRQAARYARLLEGAAR